MHSHASRWGWKATLSFWNRKKCIPMLTKAGKKTWRKVASENSSNLLLSSSSHNAFLCDISSVGGSGGETNSTCCILYFTMIHYKGRKRNLTWGCCFHPSPHALGNWNQWNLSILIPPGTESLAQCSLLLSFPTLPWTIVERTAHQVSVFRRLNEENKEQWSWKILQNGGTARL